MAKVLIIEDDMSVASIYKDLLGKEDIQVVVAPDGPKGISMAKTDKPNLILLDIMMPNMDGLEVLKRLKSDNETDLIPVIVLTNVGVDEVQKEALSMGAVMYLIKTDVDYGKFVGQIKAFMSADK